MKLFKPLAEVDQSFSGDLVFLLYYVNSMFSAIAIVQENIWLIFNRSVGYIAD